MKRFENLHPVVLLLYYVFTIGFSVLIMNPVCLSISFVCAVISAVSLSGKKAAASLKYMLPMVAAAVIINPMFNHEGATILTYLAGGNPLTLESIIYGLTAGTMLAAVLGHFSCFNKVMTSDKLVYLLGRTAPALSLVLSMALRMVPMLTEQTKRVSAAQRCMGRDTKNGGVTERIRNGVTIISIIITWSLENAVNTADSMRSRGYGLKGRTAFSLFRFDIHDAVMLAAVLILGITVLCGCVNDMLYWRCFPTIKWGDESRAAVMYIAYALLMLLCPLYEGRRKR
ncbi:MAG: energy-coupling factor transporter transmembrane component T [bacterium]|nr:energy-coupling factor transporter transmembrane component T [bacterium]